MAEALEKWPIELFSRLLPRIYQIVEEINRRFVAQVSQMYPGNQNKIAKMAIIYDGQVKMAHLAIVSGYSVNGVARLHTEILEKQELKDFYEMMPDKFNNKTNGITQRRFLLHGNPLLAQWVTAHVGSDWITDLSKISGLKIYAEDKKAQQEFMNIKYQNKVRLANYIQMCIRDRIIHALLFIPGKLRINPLLNAQAFLQELIQELIVRIRCEKKMERFIVFPYPVSYTHLDPIQAYKRA